MTTPKTMTWMGRRWRADELGWFVYGDWSVRVAYSEGRNSWGARLVNRNMLDDYSVGVAYRKTRASALSALARLVRAPMGRAL